MYQVIEWLRAHPDVRVTFDWAGDDLRISMQDVETYRWTVRLVPSEDIIGFRVDVNVYATIILSDLYSKLQ